MVIGGKTPGVTAEELGRMGFGMVGVLREDPALVVSLKERQRLVQKARFDAMERNSRLTPPLKNSEHPSFAEAFLYVEARSSRIPFQGPSRQRRTAGLEATGWRLRAAIATAVLSIRRLIAMSATWGSTINASVATAASQVSSRDWQLEPI
jgi:hypothetical protein